LLLTTRAWFHRAAPGLAALINSLVGLLGVQTVPYANPRFLHVKAKLLGPGLTYAAVAPDDDAWDKVTSGVRRGSREWLVVAADLRPALDTHPGEEMHDAVAVAIDANPAEAVGILIGAYGAEAVCGSTADGEAIPRQRSSADTAPGAVRSESSQESAK